MDNRILIIDDDPDVVLFLSTLLKDHGYKTIDAADGQEGLEKTRAENPDLILLDLMMPRKSGLSFLSDLIEDEKSSKIPVIMITGVSGETGIDLEAFFKRSHSTDRESKAVRPAGYLEKPVDPKRLLKLVKEAISRSNRASP